MKHWIKKIFVKLNKKYNFYLQMIVGSSILFLAGIPSFLLGWDASIFDINKIIKIPDSTLFEFNPGKARNGPNLIFYIGDKKYTSYCPSEYPENSICDSDKKWQKYISKNIIFSPFLENKYSTYGMISSGYLFGKKYSVKIKENNNSILLKRKKTILINRILSKLSLSSLIVLIFLLAYKFIFKKRKVSY